MARKKKYRLKSGSGNFQKPDFVQGEFYDETAIPAGMRWAFVDTSGKPLDPPEPETEAVPETAVSEGGE